jgi:hypothetical protein
VRCKTCHYSLENRGGLTEHRCPECGRTFDPDDPGTFEIEANKSRFWRRFTYIAFTCYAVPFILLALSWPSVGRIGDFDHLTSAAIIAGINWPFVFVPVVTLWACTSHFLYAVRLRFGRRN